MKISKAALLLALLAAFLFPEMIFAQFDPGVRSNTGVNAGQPLASVTASANDLAFFQTGLRPCDLRSDFYFSSCRWA